MGVGGGGARERERETESEAGFRLRAISIESDAVLEPKIGRASCRERVYVLV